MQSGLKSSTATVIRKLGRTCMLRAWKKATQLEQKTLRGCGRAWSETGRRA